MFGMVAATGVKILTQVDFAGRRENLIVVAVSIGVGLIPLVSDKFFSQMPAFLSPLLHSGILLGTLTAVALLFALYMVKPSPFCLLDELDAPLDESNIIRFTAVLKRFLDHSQFVVITHNKRTISMADVLYGVTMQERGVSKIVSVRFNKEEGTAVPAGEPANIADAVRGTRALEGSATPGQ
jgi:hypothetical protein